MWMWLVDDLRNEDVDVVKGLLTMYPQFFNFPIGHKPNFNVDHVWPNIDQFWSSFAKFAYSFFTIRPSDFCHTLQTPIYHDILSIQQLDFGFKSRKLWTCVIVPTHQEILIGHVFTIQLFDWARSSSKQIFYHTLSIQWSNFKSDYGIRWKRVVVSTYHETSITKNIQYSFKRVIYYINITKNWENDLKKHNPKSTKWQMTIMDLYVTFDFAILKLETDKNIKSRKP